MMATGIAQILLISLLILTLPYFGLCQDPQQQQVHNQQQQQQQQQQVPPVGGIYRRFEYKHSFRVPTLAQRDGTVPFWTVLGDAIASGEQLRLAPSMRSRRGAAWNKRAMVESEHFEIDVAFKVNGQGRVGADGMAIWYTAAQGTIGPVFGANDYWNGMGLLLDSFDNDGQRNNPAVSLMLNDGTRGFDHTTDGAAQVLSTCQKDFRNKQYPVSLKITYLRNVLTVLISDGLSPHPRYELCIRAENVFLPKGGFFGISAATGGLADDHDVLEFSVHSLFTDVQQLHRVREITDEERKKYELEFEQQQKQFEEERKKFKEQHPERAREDDDEMEAKNYETGEMRQLRLIYETQANIHKALQNLEHKLQEIAQNQQTGGGGRIQQGGGGGSSFAPNEKDEVLQSLRSMNADMRTIKQYASEIFTRTYTMEQKLNTGVGTPGGAGAGGGGGGGGGMDAAATRSYLESIQAEVQSIRTIQQQQQQGAPGGGIGIGGDGGMGGGGFCPPCLSTTIFLSVLTLQSLVLLMFIFFRSKTEKAKFY